MSEAGSDRSKASGAYRVLARKYRPADFSGLIGQEPLVRTLTNAFSAGRIAQAWMLTGVRGVGKTTTARILARALNYRTADIDQPSIDLQAPGEHCQAIMEGRHPDVIEMDAASHTGIDDIRDIIEQVRYAPVSARFKVYIIDEVHMLSMQAFNGLLKTLEEPPPHAKFIFATTEIRKVPITVLSRCQRFDLRRIDAALIKTDLERIAGLEGIACEPAALAMIGRAAEGSMRDAQSIFDQAIAHGAGEVTAAAVRTMLGLADRGRIIDLFEKLMRGDVAAALDEFRAQYDGGADPSTVLSDLAEFTHLVTRLRFVPSAADDPALTEDERSRGAQFAAALPVRVLSRTWQMLLKGIAEAQAASRPVDAGEMVLIRIAHAAELPTLDEALRSITEAGSAAAAAPQGRPPMPAPPAPANSAVHAPALMPSPSSGGQPLRLAAEASLAEPGLQPSVPLVQPTEPEPVVEIRSLADLAALADNHRDIAFKVLLKRCVRPVRIDNGRLEISLTADAPKTLIPDLNANLQTWTGRRWVVSVSREEGGPTLAEEEASRRQNAITDAAADPAVAAILARFPGSRIIDVRLPAAAEISDDDLPAAPGPSVEDDDS